LPLRHQEKAVKKLIDVETILKPIPGENPAGEDLRYTLVYDSIREARRADDPLSRGEWQREVKTSDWNAVISIAEEALAYKTKDLQIACWLVEALTWSDGFEGLATGFTILAGMVQNFWEHLYPELEEGDLEIRAGPIEFLNEKLPIGIRQTPLTDSQLSPGYSWLAWQQSRRVGYEKDILNQLGDVDETRKKARDELIAEAKPTAEDFDSAVARSSKTFFETLANRLATCRREFERLDGLLDEKFGRAAPRVAELRVALEETDQLVLRILREKGGREPVADRAMDTPSEPSEAEAPHPAAARPDSSYPADALFAGASALPSASPVSDTDNPEERLWAIALETLKASGIDQALGQLFSASYRAPSAREKNRCRLLMAKICLKTGRADLARPIVEELYSIIEELHLERWESPVWIGEVIESLYQCLAAEPNADDAAKARTLLQKLCTIDVTKAMLYKPKPIS
jgi:type VI secretion system protein ImpA